MCIFDIHYTYFLHDRPWTLPWKKSTSNELDITIHVIASQLSRYCDVISNRLWCHQQNEDRGGETRGRCVKIVVSSSFVDSLCRVRDKIMYVFSWRTVSALTRMLFLCVFPSLPRNSGNKHKNNPLVSAESVRHSSTYILLYISWPFLCQEMQRKAINEHRNDNKYIFFMSPMIANRWLSARPQYPYW